jgi:hypothetical protein
MMFAWRDANQRLQHATLIRLSIFFFLRLAVLGVRPIPILSLHRRVMRWPW